MGKYKYWHKITKVSDEYQKDNPEIKAGLYLGRDSKYPYSVDILNTKTGKRYDAAYTLEYLGRLFYDASSQEIYDLIQNKEKSKEE